jgi:hypothetical protein
MDGSTINVGFGATPSICCTSAVDRPEPFADGSVRQRRVATPRLTLVTDRFREVKIPLLFAVRVQGVAMAVNAHRFDQSLGEERALVRAAVSGIARSTSG